MDASGAVDVTWFVERALDPAGSMNPGKLFTL